MTLLQASNLTLEDVHRLLGLQQQFCDSFSSLLTLNPLTEYERQELQQTRSEFNAHLTAGEPSEGQIKLVAISPLLRLAGFYRPPLQVRVEEGIARVEVEDEGTTITGRFDILVINKSRLTQTRSPFWVLVVEAKGGAVSPSAGLPQLLTYAYKSIQDRAGVWGMVTNGEFYRFLYIQPGEPAAYQLLPSLNLLDSDSSMQIVQVLKAIRDRQSAS